MRVLIVDDLQDTAEVVSAMIELSRPDWSVVALSSAGDAMNVAAQSGPDAVIIDLAMPGISGLELAQRLRTQFGEGVALIAYTGVTDPTTLQETRGLMDAVVLKPTSTEELLIAVQGAWEDRQLRIHNGARAAAASAARPTDPPA